MYCNIRFNKLPISHTQFDDIFPDDITITYHLTVEASLHGFGSVQWAPSPDARIESLGSCPLPRRTPSTGSIAPLYPLSTHETPQDPFRHHSR